MKLKTPETWETQVSLKGNKATTWQDLLGMMFILLHSFIHSFFYSFMHSFIILLGMMCSYFIFILSWNSFVVFTISSKNQENPTI